MRSHKLTAGSTQEAAMWSVNAALEAASRGTFGVGGALLGPHKELLAISCNRVLADGKAADPTAHGERQLVDWYFEKRAQGEPLPAPDECTIVSSLDPCMMCAGSILTGGFKVVSTTLDTTAGVNCNQDEAYTTLPEGLREQARASFSYFGSEAKRPYQGPPVLGESYVLPADFEQRSLDTFLASLKKVQETIHAASGPLEDVRSCSDPEIIKMLKQNSPDALTLHFPNGKPDARLAQPLLQAAQEGRQRGGSFNAAALIDPHGNLVLVRSGREEISPIRTPFMELTRSWTEIRSQAGSSGERYLAPLKDCTVVTLQGPGDDSRSVLELGAYGSSVEGPVPEREQPGWQYVLERQPQLRLDEQLSKLPPLYSQIIRPRIKQVSDPELVHLCTREH